MSTADDQAEITDAHGESPRRVEVDARGAAGVMIGGKTQVNYFYRARTETDEVAAPPLVTVSGQIDSPYRGLGHFEEQDAPFFHGRDTAITAITHYLRDRLDEPGVIVVSGVSGVGKSSLLRAGVLARLRGSGLGGVPSSRTWSAMVLTPGHAPLPELALRATEFVDTDAATLASTLAADPTRFALTAAQIAHAADREYGRLLVIIDQFEQVFTQCADPDRRAEFVTALNAAATIGHGPDQIPAALVVLVVRADFEARCGIEFPVLEDAVQHRYLVPAMTELQLRVAISQPPRTLGSDIGVDLVDLLIDRVRTRTTDMTGAGVLPLLSHALDQAWRHRAGDTLTIADYERTGGIERAVADSAQRAYNSLTPVQQEVTRRVFLRLTATADDGTDTANRATRAELLDGKNADQVRDVDAVLEAFAKERLLTLSAGTVEISHEVLLRAWPLLRDQWLAGTRADRIVRTRLRSAAGEWNRSGRDPSYLYAGSLLQDAVTAVSRADHTRQPELSPPEQEFLHASNRARRRTAAIRRGALAALLTMTLWLAVATAAAYQASQTATSQRDAAIASQLVAESQAQAGTDPTAAKVKSLAAWHIAPTPRSRYALINAASRPIPGALTRLAGHVDSVTFSRDQRILATSDRRGSVRLWNVATQQQIGRALTDGHSVNFVAIAFSQDSQILATGGQEGVQLWNVATQQPIGQPFAYSTQGGPQAVAFSPDSRTLATGYYNGTVRLWNVATQQQVGHPITVDADSFRVSSVAFSPDGQTLATGHQHGVQLWNVATQQQIGHSLIFNITASAFDSVDAVAFSPDGQTLATGHQSHTVRLWDVATQQQIGQPLTAGDAGSVFSVAFSPDGRTLATGGADDSVRLWDVATQQQIGQPYTFSDANFPGFYTVAFSPDGQTLAIGLQDGMVWSWNAATQQQIGLPLTTTVSGVASAAFNSDGDILATVSQNGTVQLWNAATQQPIGQPLTVGTRRFDGIWPVAFSPNGQTLATVGRNGTVQLWNVATQQPIGQPLTVGASVFDGPSSVAFSPDGDILATGSRNGTVQLWNVATQQRVGQSFAVGTDRGLLGVDAVAFSPDGRTLATSGLYGPVQLWHVATHKQIGQNFGGGTAVAFSPDGRTLATGGFNDEVKLWNVATQQRIGPSITVGTDSRTVDTVAFSPDGQTLAIGHEDGVQLWHVATQQQIWRTLAGTDGVHAVTFRPDGRTLATANAGGIRQWNANQIVDPPGQVCDQIGGRITPDEWRQYVPVGPTYDEVCP
ncbi:WD40 repeat domain-containing protein [Nocardia gipuzkoensis]